LSPVLKWSLSFFLILNTFEEKKMSFPLYVLSSFNNNDDDRSRKSNWRCEMHERGKNVTQISSFFSILSSHIKCVAYMCVCVYDRFITERKWRNKTPLFFFSPSSIEKTERAIKLIYSNNRKVASLLSLSIYSFSFFCSCIYISISIYIWVLRQSSYYTLRLTNRKFLFSKNSSKLYASYYSYLSPGNWDSYMLTLITRASNKEHLKYLW